MDLVSVILCREGRATVAMYSEWISRTSEPLQSHQLMPPVWKRVLLHFARCSN